MIRKRPSLSAICPMCKERIALHYIVGVLCTQTDCDWASCEGCGVTVSRRDGRTIRSGSLVR